MNFIQGFACLYRLQRSRMQKQMSHLFYFELFRIPFMQKLSGHNRNIHRTAEFTLRYQDGNSPTKKVFVDALSGGELNSHETDTRQGGFVKPIRQSNIFN